jgi:hypothetical protein
LQAPLTTAQAAHELDQLNRIGIALSETRDVDQLLALILLKAREITAADAGSLYLVERPGQANPRGFSPATAGELLPEGVVQLRFKLTQNDSVQFPFTEQTLPITEASMAGHCALHGEVIELADAYRIPKSLLYFNSSFDDKPATAPLADHSADENGRGQVLGVLSSSVQKNPKVKLADAATVKTRPPERAVRMALSRQLASRRRF